MSIAAASCFGEVCLARLRLEKSVGLREERTGGGGRDMDI